MTKIRDHVTGGPKAPRLDRLEATLEAVPSPVRRRGELRAALVASGASLLHVLIGFAEAFDVPPDEWVELVDADWVDDHNFEFGTATVFTHRKHRREATTNLGAACGEFQNVGCFRSSCRTGYPR